MSADDRLRVDGLDLEIAWFGPPRDDGATLVMLHQGLGCVSLWRDFPDRLAHATGRPILVYSRRGHGRSDPWPAPWPRRYMHDEGLEVLPALLAAADIAEHILIGHSDGASIALIHAGGGKARGLRGLALMAPHLFAERINLDAVAATRKAYGEGNLRERLARHHGANVDDAFYGWADAWLHPDFLAWDLRDYPPAITAPMLLIQGQGDEYGTLAQLDAIETGAGGPTRRLVLANCGHSPHRDQADAVLAAMADFIRAL